MCWYELTVQFCESSTYMIEWPSSWGIGVLCLYLHVQSPLRKNSRLYVFLGGEASLQRLLPTKLAKELKMVSFFLMKRVSSRKDEVFSFERGMLPSQKGCGMKIISTAT